MRAVIVRDAPSAMVVDLTHEIPPFDVRQGALALERAAPHLGPGVVVAVVDPGVGTERRAVAVEVADRGGPRYLVAPDNGVLSFAIDSLGGAIAAAELERPYRPPRAGPTFDGRDLFAPIAARLWSGSELADIGRIVDHTSLVHLEAPFLELGAGELRAEVLWIDRFGNVQLAATASDAEAAGLADSLEVEVEDEDASSQCHRARRASSFSVGTGLGLIVDSNARLALVCEGRSAATVLGVRPGDVLEIRNPAVTNGERSQRAAGTSGGAAG